MESKVCFSFITNEFLFLSFSYNLSTTTFPNLDKRFLGTSSRDIYSLSSLEILYIISHQIFLPQKLVQLTLRIFKHAS